MDLTFSFFRKYLVIISNDKSGRIRNREFKIDRMLNLIHSAFIDRGFTFATTGNADRFLLSLIINENSAKSNYLRPILNEDA